ncbi:MAG: hypothetical protein ACFFG0_00335 [Candidatus Thorarchaeota archaeon]
MDFLKRQFSDFSLLGLVVFVLTILAMWLVGIPNKMAFIIFTIAQVIQIYIFYEKKQGFLILTMVALIVFNVLNYYRWVIQGVG